jgi:hypothetical protein
MGEWWEGGWPGEDEVAKGRWGKGRWGWGKDLFITQHKAEKSDGEILDVPKMLIC